jgi:hypothetical protein
MEHPNAQKGETKNAQQEKEEDGDFPRHEAEVKQLDHRPGYSGDIVTCRRCRHGTPLQRGAPKWEAAVTYAKRKSGS